MTTLYDATAALFAQTLGGLEGVLKKGRAHCEANGIDLTEMLNSRIYEDMLPLRYQVQAAIGHSVGAIEGVKVGVFKPPYGTPTDDFDALQARLHEAALQVKAYAREEIDALEHQGRGLQPWRTADAFHGRGLPADFLAAQFSFPRDDRVRYLSRQGRPARQAGLHRPSTDEDVTAS